ncbi:hypothetical protein ACFOSD_10535 [Salinispirillum marinum]|uniref:Uncharacterized protein n=2 Tax=Saccharospirillaceae TaxID=255527 RepID=A0ABV8BIE4_9GAMM
MIEYFARWSNALVRWSPVFAVITVLGGLLIPASLLPGIAERWMFVGMILLLWGLTIWCFLWWFLPQPPQLQAATGWWSRLKIRSRRLLMTVKCWLFIGIVVADLGLTYRFSVLAMS